MLTDFLKNFFNRRRDREIPDDIERAINNIFSLPDGQAVLNYLCEIILIEPSYFKDARCCDVAYHEGQRALIKLLLDSRDHWQKQTAETVETARAA